MSRPPLEAEDAETAWELFRPGRRRAEAAYPHLSVGDVAAAFLWSYNRARDAVLALRQTGRIRRYRATPTVGGPRWMWTAEPPPETAP